jgi:hypothetical protein
MNPEQSIRTPQYVTQLEAELESVKAERDTLLAWMRDRKDYKKECIELRNKLRGYENEQLRQNR